MDDYIVPGIVTSLAAFQFAHFAMQVGQVRRKLKFAPPKMTGEPEFERAYRARMLSAVPGIMYLYGRHTYFHGYMRAPEQRLPGFKLASLSLRILLTMTVAGLATAILRKYADIHLYKHVAQYSGGYL